MTDRICIEPQPTAQTAAGQAAVPFGIVVVNYGSSRLLARNLVPVTAGSSPASVVVVDNPTTGQERARVKELAARHGWAVVTPEENLGFGGGVNAGARVVFGSGAQVLVAINPDATIDAAGLERLVAAAAQPMTLAAPVIRTSSGEPWFDGAGVDLSSGGAVGKDELGRDGVEPWLTGAVIAASRQLWERVGGFDDDYFLYWEDVDLSRRVRQAGGRLEVVTGAEAIHDEGGTQQAGGSRVKSDMYYYYNIRNRMLYADKHLSASRRRSWLLHSLPQAWAVLVRGGRRQFLHNPRLLLTAAEAVRDGALGRTGARGGTRARIRVLSTCLPPQEFHNPFVKLMENSLERTGRVDGQYFTWRAALLGRYDLVHAHWPEDVLDATTKVKAAGKRACMALWLARLKLGRVPVVRTVHNLELPSGMDPVKRALIVTLDRMTSYRVLINETTPRPAGPSSVVLHGHYIDWLASYPRAGQVPGRIAYFGLVRRYKNVGTLARAFTATAEDHPDWSLRIAGRPSSEELAGELRDITAGDARVGLTLRYLTDAEIVAEVSAATLVVLPYKEMHNSGSLLLALSLARPVLVPDNIANRAIAEEVGPGWVYCYDGELGRADLERVMGAIAQHPPAGAPDLSRRDWDVSARGYLAAYEAALDSARARKPRRR